MPYLHLNDYKTYIQSAYFNQLTQADDTKRVSMERYAQSIIKGKLQQKYDVSLEFTDTKVWSVSTAYGARDRVILDFSAWAASTSYTANVSLVIHSGLAYICATTNNDATFTSNKWTLLGNQYDIFYGAYPSTCTYPPSIAEPNAPMFNYKKAYKKNDVVFWKGNTYVCAVDSSLIDHSTLLNSYYYQDLPYINVFPDDAVNNSNNQYWKTRTAYTITPGTLPTNSAWVKGDNREQQILNYMKYIVVEALAPLIAPMNIPKEWAEKRKEALYFINEMAKGDMTVDIPLLQPNTGTRIRFGGGVKIQTNY